MLIIVLLAVAMISPSTIAAQTTVTTPPTPDATAANGLVLLPPAPPIVLPPLPPPPPPWLIPPFFGGRHYGGPERFNVIPRCGVDGPSSGRVGQSLTFTSTASDRDGFVEREQWYVHTPNPADTLRDGGDSIQFTPTIAGTYEVNLHIEDDEGAVNTCAVQVQVSA